VVGRRGLDFWQGHVCALHHVPQPELVPRGKWRAADEKDTWPAALDLHVLHCVPVFPADPDVAVTGERSREEKDAEGRKRAIDVDAPPAKRSREEQARLEERVATARSASSAAVDVRLRELMQPAYARFEREEIDAEEA